MGRRKKKHHPGQSPDYRGYSDDRLGSELAGLIDRRRYRQSLEVAKEIRRRNLLEKNRTLVERAYRLRACELAGKSFWGDSAVVVENAFASGVGSAPLAELAVRSGLATGRLDAARRVLRQKPLDPEASAALLADLAVLAAPGSSPGALLPELVPPVLSPLAVPSPSVPQGKVPEGTVLAADVARVHRAFALYEKGLDREAREELSGVSLRSPLSRWRLLLRGLIARAAGGTEEARACWSRISPLGPCGALARMLLDALSAVPQGAPPCDASQPEDDPLPKPRLGDARAALLEEIRKHVEEDEEDQILPAIEKALRSWPGGLGPAARLRLARAIGLEALLGEDRDRIVSLLGLLPEDPFGLRAGALYFENKDPDEALDLWKQYLVRFGSVEGIRSEEKAIAQALIWERMGDIAANWGDGGGCNCPICRSLNSVARRGVQAGPAGRCYRNSLELDPGSIEVRKKLIGHLERTGRRRECEKEARALLARFPDDVETILRLAEAAFARSSYRKARGFLEKAQALEPLNRKILGRLADCLVCSALHRASRGRIAPAREDFGLARDLLGDAAFAKHYPVWSALETAYGNHPAGEDLLRQAIAGGLWEPKALWDAIRYLGDTGPAAEARSRLLERLRVLFRELPCDTPTALNAAGLFIEVRKKDDPALDVVEKPLRTYLERAAGLPFDGRQRTDLCHLFQAGEEFDLLALFAESGRRDFPGDYRFPLLEAEARIAAGERDLSADLLRSLQAAEGQAVRDGDPESANTIRRILRRSRPRRRPARESGGTAGSGFLQRVFEFSDGDEEDGADEEDSP